MTESPATKYYWEIKRVKDESILVSPNVGQKAQQAWEQGAETLHLPGNISVSRSVIASIEPTMKVYEDDSVYRLGDGMKPGAKQEPILNEEGAVITNWYKKNIGSQQWEKHYSVRPGYYKLVDDSGAVWVAWLSPEVTNYLRPKEQVICNEQEIKHLWGLYDQQHQH